MLLRPSRTDKTYFIAPLGVYYNHQPVTVRIADKYQALFMSGMQRIVYR
jgi:hypothetical protein